ncbi:MAG: chromosomal replication initiator protein DnaA [Polyangiaceae bacterium]|nr:chromosomal replication initiator protein DnaA [Polyangiaceae bacterium]
MGHWHEALARTRERSPATFERWFSSVQLDSLRDGVLCVSARDEFVRDWVKQHLIPDVVASLERALGRPVTVRWTVRPVLERPVCPPSAPAGVPRPAGAPSEAPPSSGPSSARGATRERTQPRAAAARELRSSLLATLNPKYTFANFVVGPSNQLAHAAANGSAGVGGQRYNPLFICGGTGLGKTHLVHAIAHKVLEARPAAQVVYVSAEHFTNEFIEALQHKRMDEFRARYRQECDVLLVDDIQFLAGREQTLEEFFHTFNALRDADKPIVVTSDKYPQQLQRMPERIVSRFSSGLVADIQSPQLETRVAIVRTKARLEGIPLDDEVAVLLAQHVQSNVRELEGALIRLAAKSSLLGRSIDLEFARAELALVAPRRTETVSVADIQRAVCNHFRLSNAELLSKDRHKSVAFARQLAMYLCRQRLKSSYPELGRAFGDRDHTTVMSAIRRIDQLRTTHPEVNEHLQAIEQRLASSED